MEQGMMFMIFGVLILWLVVAALGIKLMQLEKRMVLLRQDTTDLQYRVINITERAEILSDGIGELTGTLFDSTQSLSKLFELTDKRLTSLEDQLFQDQHQTELFDIVEES